MPNSRQKGKRGELEACEALDAVGYDCSRSVQYSGRNGDADIVCDALPGIHFEVKRTERLSPYQFLDQAIRDSKGRKVPVILYRSSNRPWMVTFRICDLPVLVEALYGARRVQAHDQQPEAL